MQTRRAKGMHRAAYLDALMAERGWARLQSEHGFRAGPIWRTCNVWPVLVDGKMTGMDRLYAAGGIGIAPLLSQSSRPRFMAIEVKSRTSDAASGRLSTEAWLRGQPYAVRELFIRGHLMVYVAAWRPWGGEGERRASQRQIAGDKRLRRKGVFAMNQLVTQDGMIAGLMWIDRGDFPREEEKP